MSKDNFSGGDFANKIGGLSSPIQRPITEEQRQLWQQANRSWWSSTPMRYDWRGKIPFDPYTKEYFAEIDSRFFELSRQFMPWKVLPFDQEIPFERLSELDVLEIGVGQGSHASLIAPRAKSFTGIDLTEPAVKSTSERMKLMDLTKARILQMDAEDMSFPDGSFDYVWSWGVVHHSADTRRILEQMCRVLRPGGQANVMVYHRSFWKYYVHDGFLRGVVQGRLFRGSSFSDVNQMATDGAIARFYKPSEWEELARDLFIIDSYRVTGLKAEIIPLPASGLKNVLERIVPDGMSRFFTNTLRWGSFLTIRMTRR